MIKKSVKSNNKKNSTHSTIKHQEELNFPFWAVIVFSKRRPTLVIDEAEALDKIKKKYVPGFVHREATHSYKKSYELISPNPNPQDKRPMYLKKPRKAPKTFFRSINKNYSIPEHLKTKYSKKKK